MGVTRRVHLSSCEQKGSGRFEKRRFVVNNEKRIWEPTDRFEWLGFIWDSGKGSVEIHEKKFAALKDNISSLLYGKEVVSARGVLFNIFFNFFLFLI
jgi:hypothetical protein